MILLIPDIPNVIIERVEVSDPLTLSLRATSPLAVCPTCGTISQRVQSRYTRTLHDLPASGRSVHLKLCVRRFFCKKSTCGQKIFAEQFPELSHPHAQRTRRLQEALCQLGFDMGGQAGAQLGSKLGFSGSRDTILRLLSHQKLPDSSKTHTVGIDDWSWKRGLRYGTLICDLEGNTPIDLRPDRSVESVSAWFQAHPKVTVVSRDRSSEYAAAILKGAPQAIQVADRWHLGKNLADCVSTLLARCRPEIRSAGQVPVLRGEAETATVSQRHPRESRAVEQARLARRAQRLDQYTQVIRLHEQGLRLSEIAQRVGMAARTVQRWLAHDGSPEPKPRRQRTRLLDSYQTYIRGRWHQGCQNGLELYRELRAKGYQGSQRGVYRYLATLEPSTSNPTPNRSLPGSSPEAGPTRPTPLAAFSAREATWLFMRKPADLSQAEQEELRLIRQASPSAQTAYRLVEAFMRMVRERTGQQLESWLQEVEASHLPEFKSFATGIQQDKAAVLAGLTLPYSNGPVEGHVNCLKLIKRSMYGQAKLDLLRQRVLHRSEKSSHANETTKEIGHKRRAGRTKKPRDEEKILTSEHTTFDISEDA